VWTVCSECVICMDAPVDVVFKPCGHSGTCAVCSARLTRCCICRDDIVRVVPI
jgi:hypothetical protein